MHCNTLFLTNVHSELKSGTHLLDLHIKPNQVLPYHYLLTDVAKNLLCCIWNIWNQSFFYGAFTLLLDLFTFSTIFVFEARLQMNEMTFIFFWECEYLDSVEWKRSDHGSGLYVI